MRLRTIGLISTLALGLFAGPLPAEAQQGKKIPRIGLLRTKTPHLDNAFLQGLRELGYVEGKNILIDRSGAESGKLDTVRSMMAEFVRLKVDVIVVHGNRAIAVAKQATDTIPIVSAYAGDLVGPGLVASVTKPGGNITGSYNVTEDVSGNRVELLLEVVPNASRIAVLGHPVYPKNKYRATVKY